MEIVANGCSANSVLSIYEPTTLLAGGETYILGGTFEDAPNVGDASLNKQGCHLRYVGRGERGAVDMGVAYAQRGGVDVRTWVY